MRTNVRANSVVDDQPSARATIGKAKSASRTKAAAQQTSIRTLDEWNAWMRARGRYQSESEE